MYGRNTGNLATIRIRQEFVLREFELSGMHCIYTRMSVRNFVYSKDLEGSCGQFSVANCRCDVSALDLRKSMWRNSKIDVSPFEDRRSMSRCVDLRRSMC